VGVFDMRYSAMFVIECKVFELSVVEGPSVLPFGERSRGVSRAVLLGKVSDCVALGYGGRAAVSLSGEGLNDLVKSLKVGSKA